MASDVEEIERRLESVEERVSELESRLDEGEVGGTRGGIKDFVKRVDPPNHIERAAVIGYYLENSQDYSSFTTQDVKEAYSECKLQTPANLSDTLAKGEERGLIIRSGKEGQSQLWEVSMDTEDYVRGALEDDF